MYYYMFVLNMVFYDLFWAFPLAIDFASSQMFSRFAPVQVYRCL